MATSMKTDAGDLAIAQAESAERRITAAQYDLIWAALRLYAGAIASGRARCVEDIATNCGMHSNPTAEEVHDLADRFADHSGLRFY